MKTLYFSREISKNKSYLEGNILMTGRLTLPTDADVIDETLRLKYNVFTNGYQFHCCSVCYIFCFFITKILFFLLFLCIICLIYRIVILFFRLFYEFTLKLLLFHIFYIKFNQLRRPIQNITNRATMKLISIGENVIL